MNQRANGEGSIYRRADGRWTAACYVLRPDGTRVRRSVYGKTRKDVADQLAVLIAKTKAGLPLAVESWSLERFADHWLKHVVGSRLFIVLGTGGVRRAHANSARQELQPTTGTRRC
jgi:integrase